MSRTASGQNPYGSHSENRCAVSLISAPSSAPRERDRRGVWEVTGAREARRGVTTHHRTDTRQRRRQRTCAPFFRPTRGRQSGSGVVRSQTESPPIASVAADCDACLRRARRSPRWERLALSALRDHWPQRQAAEPHSHPSSSLHPPFPACSAASRGSRPAIPPRSDGATMPRERTRNKRLAKICGETEKTAEIRRSLASLRRAERRASV